MISVTNLAQNLTDTTRIHAGRVAVRVDNAAMTYRALDEASARVAGLLHERGLKQGDRVGIMLPNVAEVPVVYYGVLRAGGVRRQRPSACAALAAAIARSACSRSPLATLATSSSVAGLRISNRSSVSTQSPSMSME